MTIGPISVDCARLRADAGTIDRIARLQLEARRRGVDLRLENPTECLIELIGLCGLSEALRVEVEWQSE